MKRTFPRRQLTSQPRTRHSRASLAVEPLEARCLLNSNVLVNDPKMDGDSRRDTQSEAAVIVAVDGTVVVAFNDSYTAGSEQFTGYAVSSDGGASFADMGSLPVNPNGDAGDPSLARDEATGILYLSTLPFLGSAVHVFRSYDNGVSFVAPVNGAPGQSGLQDKERIAVDNFPGDGQSNVYLVWRNFGSGNGIFFSRSSDYGESFGPAGGVQIASAATVNVQGAHVTVGPDHTVYVFWFEQSSPQRLMVRKSFDFGDTWEPAVQVTSLQTTGSNGNLNLGPFRTNAYPQAFANPVTGALYIVYNDRGAAPDRADVYFRQSLDGGETWSERVRLNDDKGTNDQWFPALAVTTDGSRVGIFWYDRRLDAANEMIDRFGVIGYVIENEVYFDVNERITDESFPVVVGVDPGVLFNYMGEYDTAWADDYCFYTVWGDNRLPSASRPGNNADVRFSSLCPWGLPGSPGRTPGAKSVGLDDALADVVARLSLGLTSGGAEAPTHRHFVPTPALSRSLSTSWIADTIPEPLAARSAPTGDQARVLPSRRAVAFAPVLVIQADPFAALTRE